MCSSLPCAGNASTFLSLHVLENKKKHILIRSPLSEYVKKGLGQQAEKNSCNTKQTWSFLLRALLIWKQPRMSSHRHIPTSQMEITATFSELPEVPENLIHAEPDKTQTFKFIRHFAKPVCYEIVFIKIPGKHNPASMSWSLWWFKDLTQLLLDFLREKEATTQIQALLSLQLRWMLFIVMSISVSTPVSHGPLSQAYTLSMCNKDVEEGIPSHTKEVLHVSPLQGEEEQGISPCLP